MTSPQSNTGNPQGPKRRWLRYIFNFVVLVLLIWGTLRACSDSEIVGGSHSYRIAQERISNTIYISGKERNVEAFLNDLMSKIAEQEDLRFQVFSVTSEGGVLGLDSGDYDAIITTLIPSADNKNLFEFSDPLYRFGAVLIVRQDSPIKSLNEMSGKIIGISRDESTFFDIGIYPTLIYYNYNNGLDAFDDLQKGRVDGVIMNAWAAYSLAQGLFRGKVKVVTMPFTKEALRVSTLKNSRFSKVLPAFNEGLKKVKDEWDPLESTCRHASLSIL